MKPLPETPRFPTLNVVLCVILSIACGISVVCFALRMWFNSPQYPNSQIATLLVGGILCPIALVITTFTFYYPVAFTINHLAGRYLVGDNTPINSVFADAYVISTRYTLPYAYNYTTKRGDHVCELHSSLSYADILHAYQTLKKRHKLVYYFRTISLPNHLGRRCLLLTRAGAKRLLQEMSAIAAEYGTPLEEQRALLRYAFYPNYAPDLILPEHQTFISRDIIRDLMDQINPDPAVTPLNAVETIVDYDVDRSIALSAGYLRTTFTRIATEDEFIYLPVASD